MTDLERIRTISDQALALARRAATGASTEADHRSAAALARELQDLRPALDTAEGHDAQGAQIAYSEAFVDLDWVLSGGRTPASIRLTVILRGGGPPGPPG